MLNVSPKTLQRYSELIRVHVRPNLGAIPIQKLQAAHLAGYTRACPRWISPRTAGHVHRVVHKALAVAVQWNIVSRNVAGAAEPPKVPAAEIEICRKTRRGCSCKSCVAAHFICWPCWNSPPACDGANRWPCAGPTLISTALS